MRAVVLHKPMEM